MVASSPVVHAGGNLGREVELSADMFTIAWFTIAFGFLVYSSNARFRPEMRSWRSEDRVVVCL